MATTVKYGVARNSPHGHEILIAYEAETGMIKVAIMGIHTMRLLPSEAKSLQCAIEVELAVGKGDT